MSLVERAHTEGWPSLFHALPEDVLACIGDFLKPLHLKPHEYQQQYQCMETNKVFQLIPFFVVEIGLYDAKEAVEVLRRCQYVSGLAVHAYEDAVLDLDALWEPVKSTKTLASLVLGSVTLNWAALTDALRHNKTLRILELDNLKPGSRSDIEEYAAFFDAVQMHPELVSLSLEVSSWSSELSARFLAQLCEFLRGGKLTTLCLSPASSFDAHSGHLLSDAIKVGKLEKLMLLLFKNVPDNVWTDEEALDFLRQLCESSVKEISLDIPSSPFIAPSYVRILCESAISMANILLDPPFPVGRDDKFEPPFTDEELENAGSMEIDYVRHVARLASTRADFAAVTGDTSNFRVHLSDDGRRLSIADISFRGSHDVWPATRRLN